MKTMERANILTDAVTYKPEIIADNLSLAAMEEAYSDYELRLKALKRDKDILHDAILIKFEKEFGHQVKSWTNPETGGTLSRSLPITTDIDQVMIKKLVTPEQYAVITETKVVLEKLKAAITSRVVNPIYIAKAIETTEVDKLTWYPAKR
jgi:hypothetical protein